MRSFLVVALVACLGVSACVRAQHQNVDPAYLRQYYQQLQQQQQAGGGQDATPIYEQNSEQSQQYIRAQQQQQQQQQQQYVAPAVREYLQHQHQPQQQQVQYQTQPQQVVYRQPQAAPAPRPRPQAVQYQAPAPSKGKLQSEDEEEYDDSNSSYQFGFDVKDDEFTNYQNRKEVRDGSVIKGSYSVVDSDGFIRTVKYTADPKEGFKAEVIREPTDIVVKVPTPAPQIRSGLKSQEYSPKQFHHQQQPQQQYHQYQQ